LSDIEHCTLVARSHAVSTLQIEVDEATNDALATLAASRGTTPAGLVSELVSHYVKSYEKHTNGKRGESKPADEATTGPDRVAELAVKHLGWSPNDPRLVNRRRSPLDELVGSADYDPVDDIDEVIYGR
jgi:hypothetical protein